MSKFKIRATLDGEAKSFEFGRGQTASFSSLRSDIISKHGISGNVLIRYQNPRGEQYEVGNDQQLEKVFKEAIENRSLVLELKVVAASQSHSTSSTSTASSPAKTYTPASTTPTSTPTKSAATGSSPASTKVSTPTALAAGEQHVITWNIPGDKSAALNKPKIQIAQTSDEFTFYPLPCQHDTEIRVLLVDGSQLVFECTYSYEDMNFGGQKGISTTKSTQKVGLPIKVATNVIQIEGHKITIPH